MCPCCGAAATLEGQHSHLVLDSRLEWVANAAHAVMAGHEIVTVLEAGE